MIGIDSLENSHRDEQTDALIFAIFLLSDVKCCDTYVSPYRNGKEEETKLRREDLTIIMRNRRPVRLTIFFSLLRVSSRLRATNHPLPHTTLYLTRCCLFSARAHRVPGAQLTPL